MQKGSVPIIILVGILILASIGGAYYFLKLKTPEPKACIMDAKICPDGSSVGRVGPNCEFSPCPKSSPSPSPVDETGDWKIYTNSKYNFTVKYPIKMGTSQESWQYEEFSTGSSMGVGFGTPSSKSGGYIWGIWITEDEDVENLIKQMGSQFTDRKERRENIKINGVPALLVTVTTGQVKEFNWVSKDVYIQKDNRTYSIGNGAHDSPEFELFYNTFKFLDK